MLFTNVKYHIEFRWILERLVLFGYSDYPINFDFVEILYIMLNIYMQ